MGADRAVVPARAAGARGRARRCCRPHGRRSSPSPRTGPTQGHRPGDAPSRPAGRAAGPRDGRGPRAAPAGPRRRYRMSRPAARVPRPPPPHGWRPGRPVPIRIRGSRPLVHVHQCGTTGVALDGRLPHRSRRGDRAWAGHPPDRREMIAAIRVGLESALEVERRRPAAHAKLVDFVLVGVTGVLVLAVAIALSAFATLFSRAVDSVSDQLRHRRDLEPDWRARPGRHPLRADRGDDSCSTASRRGGSCAGARLSPGRSSRQSGSGPPPRSSRSSSASRATTSSTARSRA